MADKTLIEWCDATWSPITGCSVISPGCKHCYAMRLAGTRLKHIESRKGLTEMTKSGPVWTGEVRFNTKGLRQPISWRQPRLIFVCAHADMFHEEVPDEWIDLIHAVMESATQHVYQVLTKRSDRAAAYTRKRYKGRSAPAHIWYGASVEDRARRYRIEEIRFAHAAVRFLSIEPLLQDIGELFLEGINWVIVGGESGPRKRPFDAAWARDIRDQCKAAKVPFFMKQMDGKQLIPPDLMIRQFPT